MRGAYVTLVFNTDMSTILEAYRLRTLVAVEKFLSFQSPYKIYGMMRYFMGFADEDLQPAHIYGGKHFRSALCLLIADLYGDGAAALPVAVSVELFHNFTLIHDDIVDKDTLRRGRPTVWKIWGIPHALNTGDGQLLLVYRALAEAIAQHPDRGLRTHQFLTERYLEIIEGQYLDFTLTDLLLEDREVTSEAYFTMIRKKTAVLVGAAAQAGGMIAGATEEECVHLYAYGLALGLAVQLNDDYMSIWGDVVRTGKDAQGDIRERKKTLPVLYARDTLGASGKKRLHELYASGTVMTESEVSEVMALLAASGAKEYVEASLATYVEEALRASEMLSCSSAGKMQLQELFSECLPR